jgi:hypothetical protein
MIYTLHLRLREELLTVVREFKSKARSSEFRVFSAGNKTSRLGAGSILRTAEGAMYRSFSCKLFLLLNCILFDSDASLTSVTLAQLREKVAGTTLVFLDEVP